MSAVFDFFDVGFAVGDLVGTTFFFPPLVGGGAGIEMIGALTVTPPKAPLLAAINDAIKFPFAEFCSRAPLTFAMTMEATTLVLAYVTS